MAVLVTSAAGAEETRVDLGGGAAMVLVRVQAGTFRQGSEPSDPDRESDETVREVTLSEEYLLGKYPVTRGEFALFVQETKYRTEAERGTSGGFGWDGQNVVQKPEFNWRSPGFVQTDMHPVVDVTFEDAKQYTKWLSGRAGAPFRLPSEAEFEFAAQSRGAVTKKQLESLGWFKTNAGNSTHPVGERRSNPLGLYDMEGNVNEWCEDVYVALRSPEAVRDPIVSGPGGKRVLRGGSWNRDVKRGRAAARYSNSPGSRNPDNGFRVAVLAKDLASARPGTPSTSGGASSIGSESSRGNHVVGIALAVIGSVIALFFVAGVWIARRMRSKSSGAEILADGFRFASDLQRGTRYGYRSTYRGKTTTGIFLVGPDPQGTFVYTGQKPDAVEVFLSPLNDSSSDAQRSAHVAGAMIGAANARAGKKRHVVSESSSTTDDDDYDGPPSAY